MWIGVILWIMVFLACQSAKTPVIPEGCDQTQNPDFATCVQPIFNRRCVGCHGSNGGLSLEEGQAEANLINVPSTCNPAILRVAPGNPDQSLLYLKVTDDPMECGSVMPPSGPLPQEEATAIKNWIRSLPP